MKIKATSLLGNMPKYVDNKFEVSSLKDLDVLFKAVVTNRNCVLTRPDGKELTIVHRGSLYTEVYNQKQLLLDWCNEKVDEFPNGGMYAKASI
jgi:hypothetical protein